MRYSSPQTVDISAEPLTPVTSSGPQVFEARSVIRQTLGVDAFLLFISLMMGVLCSSAIGAVDAGSDLDTTLLRPSTWFIYVACGTPAFFGFMLDTLSASSNPLVLPFAHSENRAKAIYAKRIHLMLLAFYFTSILVGLCWSAPSMLLLSKVFVSAVFAIALYALGQSIPSRRNSFIVSGILFLVVLVTTQAFIMMRLEADSARVEQNVIDTLPGVIEDAPERALPEPGDGLP